MKKLLKTPSLEEAADMLYGVNNTNVESTLNKQTSVNWENNDNQTEIQD
jgi:hypothetical protein